jgi:2,5-diketo-D-gluconate reductase A
VNSDTLSSTKRRGRGDFELSAAELAAVDSLDTGKLGGPKPADITIENFGGRSIPEA